MTDPAGFVEGILDETRDEINRADTKASILLGGTGVAVAALVGAMYAAKIKTDDLDAIIWAFGLMSAAAFAASIALLGAAVMPRIGKATPGRARYFMDHAQYDDINELQKAIEFELTDVELRHLHQVRDLARIVKTKYQLAILGEWSAGVGILLACLTAITYAKSTP